MRRGAVGSVSGTQSRAPTANSTSQAVRWTPALADVPFAPIGACAYVGGVGLAFRWDLPLIVLAICALLSTVGAVRRPAAAPLTTGVLLFFAVTAISVFASRESGESLRLSASLLPGGLLFFVIAVRFQTSRDIANLFLCFSLVAVALSVWLLWNAWLDGPISPNVWTLHAGTPWLVVGNDVTFLAIVAPLSFALMCRQSRPFAKALCGVPILLSAAVIGAFASRGALVSFAVALGAAAWLLRPRLAVAGGVTLVALVTIVDGALGLPFVTKFGNLWGDAFNGGRVDLWQTAWSTFRAAPWLGHGPYTVVYTAADGREIMRWAHNLYLDVLVGQGLAGLIALSSLLVAAFWRAWKTHQTASADTRILNAGALAGLTAFCVSGVYETSLLRLWAVISLFALLGVIARLSVVATVQELESS